MMENVHRQAHRTGREGCKHFNALAKIKQGEYTMSTIEMTITAKTYREIQAEIKELEAQAETLKQRMIAEMDTRQVEELAAGEYTIRYKLIESSRLDTARLRQEESDIFEAYTKTTVGTRFNVA